MTNGSKFTNDAVTKEKPKQPKVEEKKDKSLNDAYKFGIFCIRALLAAATGRVIGDAKVDAALGDAIASIHHPQDIADQGTAYNIAIRGAAGAWKAVEVDDEWE